MNKKHTITKKCIIAAACCACLFSCILFGIYPPPQLAKPAGPTFNDVAGYYRQIFPEKRKTRHLGFHRNNENYVLEDFDGDGIINTEDPYPFDVFFRVI